MGSHNHLDICRGPLNPAVSSHELKDKHTFESMGTL